MGRQSQRFPRVLLEQQANRNKREHFTFSEGPGLLCSYPSPPSEVALPGLSRAPSSFYTFYMDQEILMECDRCQGLMLKDYLVSMVGPSQQAWLCVWRCLDCGSEIDPLTLTTPQKGC